MIICKYKKVGVGAFYSHLIVLRTFSMAIRRAGIEINYSQGFNPHELIYFSQPLSIGIDSYAEYLCVDSQLNATEFKELLNKTLPSCIEILGAKNIIKNPNLAAKSCAAQYMIDFKTDINQEYINSIQISDSHKIEIFKNGQVETKEIRDRILDIRALDSTKIITTLTCGNENLRADLLAKSIASQSKIKADSIDISKHVMYAYNVDAIKEPIFSSASSIVMSNRNLYDLELYIQ